MPQNRTRFKFGLRFLLALTFIAALGFAWVSWQCSEGTRHELIAAKLNHLGCDVRFSHRMWVRKANSTSIEEKSMLPDIIERLGLARAVRRISRVTIPKGADAETATTLLKRIRRVESLSIYETKITQSQLADLLNNVSVRKLFIRAQSLPSDRMTWLNHDGLTGLSVARTQFSNPAIADLPPSLVYFDATRTRINDDGLNSFVRLAKLKSLDLRQTPTSESEINRLKKQMPWCEIKWEPLVQP